MTAHETSQLGKETDMIPPEQVNTIIDTRHGGIRRLVNFGKNVIYTLTVGNSFPIVAPDLKKGRPRVL